MARTRRARADLTESWDDVPDHFDDADDSYEEEDRATRRNAGGRGVNFANGHDSPRKRVTRSSVEPELVMPSSPNAINGKTRAKTPHFRLNQRSMTSDAGDLDAGNRMRAQTPRFRLNERSMTSDAGRYGRQYSSRSDEMGPETTNYPAEMWHRILRPVLEYCGEVAWLVLHNFKPLLSFGLFLYVIVAAFIFGSGFLTNSINNALSPICRIPGVTYFFNPPFCPAVAEIAGPAEFDKLVQAQSAFNDVLAASSTGVNLPLDMKKSEAGIRDLKHVVQYSTLPSKNELVYEFAGFIETARQASQDLSKFNSRIGRAVDHILSTNRWTLTVIDGIASNEASRGSVAKVFSAYLNIFAPFQPVSLSQDMLLDQYLRHTSAVEEQIANLITEAQALLAILNNLDDRLDVIAGITTRDGLKAEENRDELFAFLWTKLGGNRASVKKLNDQIQLLRNVGQYRRVAWAHVTTTIVKLQSIRDDLEELRARVAMPETVGTDRVPLEVHIQAINLGIQRLEEQRDTSRKVEADAYQRVLSRAEAGDAKMIADREM